MRRIVVLLCLGACTAGGTDGDPSDPDACAMELGAEADQTAIQTALIEASEGDVICFAEHTFELESELSLSVDGVTLRGAGQDKTVFDFSGQTSGANGISVTGDDVTLEQFRVQHTPGDGIRATSVTNITFDRLTVHWDPPNETGENGAYGLYPIGCENVKVTDCTVTGARDAGIYVGQSKRILVENSVAYGNVAGIEIENSTDAEVTGCEAYENTAGILVFNLPGLPIKDGQRAKIHGNVIRDNNLDNFAVPGTIVADVPSGLGTMIWAADHTELGNNTITNNRTAGTLLISYSEAIFGNPNDPDYDLYAEHTYIHDNVYSDNGQDPQGQLSDFIVDRPAPDIVVDGCGEMDLCVENNGAATYVDIDVCGLFQNQSSDIDEVTCAHDPLPSIDL